VLLVTGRLNDVGIWFVELTTMKRVVFAVSIFTILISFACSKKAEDEEAPIIQGQDRNGQTRSVDDYYEAVGTVRAETAVSSPRESQNLCGPCA
jgi:hypothetical protein